MAVWATPVMTVGHLLLAAAVTTYLLLDALWQAHKAKSGGARQPHPAFSLQGQRVAR
jgi:hypothetical protein